MNDQEHEDEVAPLLHEPGYQRLLATALNLVNSDTVEISTDSSSDALPRDFGRYRLVEQIGQGGMGCVYRAIHPDSDRAVAVKVIRAGLLNEESNSLNGPTLQRFKLESQATANLEHDNIITVYDVGEVDGDLFYVMRLVEGDSLNQLARKNPLENDRAARIVAAAADGVHHAHRSGVLHRDLKPANIMLGNDDRPLVMDFGLAKLLESETSQQTRTDAIVGTVAYMSPEQATNAANVGPATDIYGLGTVLYFLLTGQPPFGSTNYIHTLKLVQDSEPGLPSALNSKVAKDLETICLKCLRKEPERRYQSAEELATDLRRYLDRRPILARRTTVAERSRKWIRRNPVVAALGFLLAASLIAGAIANHFVSLNARKNLARDQARSVLTADLNGLPLLIEQLQANADFEAEMIPSPVDEESLFRVNLALLNVEPDRLESLLGSLGNFDAQQIDTLLKVVRGSHDDLVLSHLDQIKPSNESALQLSCLKAGIAAQKQLPLESAEQLAKLLAEKPADELVPWLDLLRPYSATICDQCWKLMGQGLDESSLSSVATVVVHLGEDDKEQLINLLAVLPATELPQVIDALEKNEPTELPSFDSFRYAPYVSDQQRDEFRRETNFLVARIGLLDDNDSWIEFSDYENAERQTELIHNLYLAGIPSDSLIKRLADDQHPDIVYAAILAMSEYPAHELSDPELANQLLEIYTRHPDAGVHSVTGHVLSRLRLREALENTAWAEGRDWYVAGGVEMSVISGPGEIELSWNEAAQFIDEPLARGKKKVLIDSFAISTNEITRETFEALLENPNPSPETSPTSKHPVIHVTFNEAARFCNLLSLEAGIAEDQLCYDITADGKVTLVDDFRARTGFRLPMQSEWEFAASNGLFKNPFYGKRTEHAGSFAWLRENSSGQYTNIPGTLKPNRFGLFDVIGNVSEWVHRDINEIPNATEHKIESFVGYDFTVEAGTVGTAYGAMIRTYSTRSTGFRIVQSIPGRQ
ncbi:MAG: bifunctional serine/threonine-protein kinase/formylglycine-generating enzyme family protein [Planctomycetota bacterium]